MCECVVCVYMCGVCVCVCGVYVCKTDFLSRRERHALRLSKNGYQQKHLETPVYQSLGLFNSLFLPAVVRGPIASAVPSKARLLNLPVRIPPSA